MNGTVHQGPKGGTEYRLWTTDSIFRIVGKFKAWQYMNYSERAKAEELEAGQKARKAAQADNTQAWRYIMRGG